MYLKFIKVPTMSTTNRPAVRIMKGLLAQCAKISNKYCAGGCHGSFLNE